MWDELNAAEGGDLAELVGMPCKSRFEGKSLSIEEGKRLQLSEDDLRDPQLLIESRTALDELTQLLKLGSVYPFQQG